HGVARLKHRRVDGHVRLGAGVRLDVGVLGAEELLRALDRERLDLVDHLAAAVVALAGVALRVLVRRHAGDRLEDARPREVLGGDQLDLPTLPLELAADQVGDLRVDVCEARLAERGQGPFSDGHRAGCYSAGSRAAPSRSTRGSGPVRSSTVEGTPGNSP